MFLVRVVLVLVLTVSPAFAETVCLSVCVCCAPAGFTKLNETFAARGPGGAEQVTFHLNTYFSLLLTIIDKV